MEELELIYTSSRPSCCGNLLNEAIFMHVTYNIGWLLNYYISSTMGNCNSVKALKNYNCLTLNKHKCLIKRVSKI